MFTLAIKCVDSFASLYVCFNWDRSNIPKWFTSFVAWIIYCLINSWYQLMVDVLVSTSIVMCSKVLYCNCCPTSWSSHKSRGHFQRRQKRTNHCHCICISNICKEWLHGRSLREACFCYFPKCPLNSGICISNTCKEWLQGRSLREVCFCYFPKCPSNSGIFERSCVQILLGGARRFCWRACDRNNENSGGILGD